MSAMGAQPTIRAHPGVLAWVLWHTAAAVVSR